MDGWVGVIIFPEGNNETEYYWNIGNDTNNMAEAYGLWQEFKQLKAMRVDEAIVLGDSHSEFNNTGYEWNKSLSKLKIIQTVQKNSFHLKIISTS